MAGYKILQDNSKKDAILQIEGVCPCCEHYPSVYREVSTAYKRQQGRQFLYNCPNCGGKWQGNIYDQNLNLI